MHLLKILYSAAAGLSLAACASQTPAKHYKPQPMSYVQQPRPEVIVRRWVTESHPQAITPKQMPLQSYTKAPSLLRPMTTQPKSAQPSPKPVYSSVCQPMNIEDLFQQDENCCPNGVCTIPEENPCR